MEVGSFFEIYTHKNKENYPNAQEISNLCNLNLVEKKLMYENQQIMMMGFRNYMLEKYVQKLVESNYTVVVFVQEKEKNGKNIVRVLQNIYSCGTFIPLDDLRTEEKNTQYVVCIWFELLKMQVNRVYSDIIIGVSAVNVFTGHSAIFEYETQYLANPTTFDELDRFISTFNPSEVILIAPRWEEGELKNVLKNISLNCNNMHCITKTQLSLSSNETMMEKIQNCEKQIYTQKIVSFYFPEENQNIIHHSEFQKNTIATQSFCFLLDFLKEHNCDLTRKIVFPVFTNTSERVILANHTLQQLNIINDNTTDGKTSGILSSVMSLLNKCKTSIGRRRFQRQLLNPTFSIPWLESEYSKIDTILNSFSVEGMAQIRSLLFQTHDVEKITRQLISRKIYPSSIYQLYETICLLEKIDAFVKERVRGVTNGGNGGGNGRDNGETKGTFETIIDGKYPNGEGIKTFLETHFCLDICKDISSLQTFEKNIIQPHISPLLDRLVHTKQECESKLNHIHRFFNGLSGCGGAIGVGAGAGAGAGAGGDFVKIHETEKGGISFQITKKRGTALKKTIAEKFTTEIIIPNTDIVIPLKELHFVTASSTNDEITFPLLSTICKNIQQIQEDIQIQIQKEYIKLLEKIETDWYPDILQCIEYIGCVDVLTTKAHIAQKFNYCRPVPVATAEKSFFKATKMRHCLIEHIQTSEIYVPNDIHLGIDGTNGVLLYGTNAIGKTSLIRSIGICVILAQAGMYVPCETFEYHPYRAIYSRIVGNDNLFKNMSSFQVEMSELRVILRQSDENSLILGDEVCNSTEMESGLSIIMSSFIELHQRKSSFIFATHFHEIMRFEEMRELKNISIKHLEVHYDPSTGKLVYDRKLKDGMGITSYGLTVCQSMNLPTEFMERAIQIRNKYYPSNSGVLSYQPSRYNAKKLKEMCEMCKKEFAVDTHHIHPQKNADKNGYIKTDGKVFSKNHTANLMSLCEQCHKNMHFG